MKKILLLLLAIPFFASAQNRLLTATGVTVSNTPVTAVTNTAAVYTILQDTIKGKTLSTYKKVTFRAIISLTTSLANPTITFKVNYGAGSMTITSAVALSLSLTNTPIVIEGFITNTGTTNSQFMYASIRQGTTAAIPLSGNMNFVIGNSAVDSTADQLLTLTSQFGSALTGTTMSVKYWEILRDL